MTVKTIPLFKGGTVETLFILCSTLEIKIPLTTQGLNYV
jgi:hypothetical protein